MAPLESSPPLEEGRVISLRASRGERARNCVALQSKVLLFSSSFGMHSDPHTHPAKRRRPEVGNSRRFVARDNNLKLVPLVYCLPPGRAPGNLCKRV